MPGALHQPCRSSARRGTKPGPSCASCRKDERSLPGGRRQPAVRQRGAPLLGAGATLIVLVALLSFPGFRAVAADLEPATFWKRYRERGLYERMWELFRLYENESNSVVQGGSIIGRYQGQYWAVDSAQGSEGGWENRRMFLGAEARCFHQLTLQAQMRASEDFNPFYDGLFQAFAEWSPDGNFSTAVGRVDFLLAGLERSTSSTRIPTFERGLLVNQLMPGEVVGAVAKGEPGRFHYRAGVFSGSIDPEFTTFEGGVGTMAGIGHDLPVFYEKGVLHLDYVFNDGDPLNNAFKPYDHILSLWHRGEVGPLGVGVVRWS